MSQPDPHARAEKLLDAGLWLHRSGDVQGARLLFLAVTELDTDNAVARKMLSGHFAGQERGDANPSDLDVPPDSTPVPAPETLCADAPLEAADGWVEIPQQPLEAIFEERTFEDARPAPLSERGQDLQATSAERPDLAAAPPDDLRAENEFFEEAAPERITRPQPWGRKSTKRWVFLGLAVLTPLTSALAWKSWGPSAPRAAVRASLPPPPLPEPSPSLRDVPTVEGEEPVALRPARARPEKKVIVAPAKRAVVRFDKDEILDPYAH